MSEKRISVGVKYKNIFDSIVSLVNKNALPNLDIKVVNNEIHSKQRIFNYDNNMTAVNDISDTSITKTGASWFGVFRNQSIDTSDSEWIDFVNEVSESYHKEYSFFEFPEISHKKTDSQLVNEKKILAALSKLFFENIYDDLHLVESKYVSSDIFGVNLRLEINRGTGALQPLIGKVYFEKDQNGNLTPISSSVADEIEGFFIQNMTSSGLNKINSNIDETEKLSNLVCSSLDMLISGKTILEFSDCFNVSNSEDIEIMEEIIRRGSAGVLDINCTNVRILSITHAVWKNQVYYVGIGNNKLLEFKFGLNNCVTLKCVNCSEIIIENNKIHCFDTNNEKEYDYYINYENQSALPYVGLTKEEIEDILIHGPFKKHLFKNSCKINNRNINCSRVICSKQAMVSDGKTICKTCPYPEKLYINRNGVKVITQNTEFDRDSMELVSKGKVSICKYCHRAFQFSISEQGLCPICDLAKNHNKIINEKYYKSLYSKYSSVLPLHVRIQNTKTKYAFEDDEIVVLVVGKKKYMLKKTGLPTKGYISSAFLKKIEG